MFQSGGKTQTHLSDLLEQRKILVSRLFCPAVPVILFLFLFSSPVPYPPQHPADQERETRWGDTGHDAMYICNLQKSSWRPPALTFDDSPSPRDSFLADGRNADAMQRSGEVGRLHTHPTVVPPLLAGWLVGWLRKNLRNNLPPRAPSSPRVSPSHYLLLETRACFQLQHSRPRYECWNTLSG